MGEGENGINPYCLLSLTIDTVMEGTMKRAILVAIIATFIGTATVSCTTGEVLSGAAGAGAGYIIGKETSDDDD